MLLFLGIVLGLQILTLILILTSTRNSSAEHKLEVLGEVISGIGNKSERLETMLREGLRDLRTETDKIGARIEAFGTDAKSRDGELRES